jgi:hypothetical protein
LAEGGKNLPLKIILILLIPSKNFPAYSAVKFGKGAEQERRLNSF